MMLKPLTDSLLKEVPSKYLLVILASKRTHELDEGVQPTVESLDSVRSAGHVLEGIEAGTVISGPNPKEKREHLRIECEERKRQREQEQKELENCLRDERN